MNLGKIIKNKYKSTKDENGKELNNIFEVIKEKVYHIKSGELSHITEIQPYEEELKEAKKRLINQGIENHSKQDIENAARELLIRRETIEEEQQKITTFMNAVEETDIYNRVKIGSLLKNEKDIKALVAYELEYKKKLDDFNKMSVNGGKAVCMKQSWNRQCQKSNISIDRLSDIISLV